MITIKNKHAQELMAIAGRLLAELFVQLNDVVVPGVSTHAIDAFIEDYLRCKGLVSQTKGYHTYRHSSCVSVNDVVVHGIPCEKTILKEGDLVKVDVCASWKGYCADMARCFFVNKPHSKADQHLVEVAYRSLDKGIEQAFAGNKLSSISAAIQGEVERHGYGVVRDFAGHGIGKRMHEDPEILNYGKPGKGPVLQPGMAFAIEPMITMGDYAVFVAPDGWTAKTVDKSLAAHVEDTIIITEHGPQIITRL